MSRVFAMPYAGAYLADLGAEVIKVESCQIQFMDTTRTLNGPYPENDPGEQYWERGGTFQTLNRGQRSLTLDFRAQEALDIVKRLVSVRDIVSEQLTPMVLRGFALVLGVQAFGGGLGVALHLRGVAGGIGPDLCANLLYGPPIFAPLLFVDLALLSGIGVFDLTRRPP